MPRCNLYTPRGLHTTLAFPVPRRSPHLTGHQFVNFVAFNFGFPSLEVQEADGIVTSFLRSSRFLCFDLFAFQVFRLAQASLLRRRLLLLKPRRIPRSKICRYASVCLFWNPNYSKYPPAQTSGRWMWLKSIDACIETWFKQGTLQRNAHVPLPLLRASSKSRGPRSWTRFWEHTFHKLNCKRANALQIGPNHASSSVLRRDTKKPAGGSCKMIDEYNNSEIWERVCQIYPTCLKWKIIPSESIRHPAIPDSGSFLLELDEIAPRFFPKEAMEVPLSRQVATQGILLCENCQKLRGTERNCIKRWCRCY